MISQIGFRKDQNCTKRNMNALKCHGNSSNSCQDELLKTTKVNFMVVLKGSSGDHQSHFGISRGNHEYLYPISILIHSFNIFSFRYFTE